MTDAEKVRRALGDPVIDDFSDEVRKLRRNLLISSSFALVYVFGGIEIQRTTPLGIEISGLSDDLLTVVLVILVLYNLVHVVWNAVDYLGVWRIHLTGTRLAFKTTAKLGSQHADYPDQPKQSNLYRWWQDNVTAIGNVSQTSQALKEAASQLRAAARDYEPLRGSLPRDFFSSTASNISKSISRLDNQIEKFMEFSSSYRLPISLDRFDRWFLYFKTSQLLRLFVIDLGFPCVLGIAALLALIARSLSLTS